MFACVSVAKRPEQKAPSVRFTWWKCAYVCVREEIVLLLLLFLESLIGFGIDLIDRAQLEVFFFEN